RAADQARLCPQRSCSKKISPVGMGFKRLRHDADVGDARLLDSIHDGSEGAEGNIFIGAKKSRLMLRVADFRLQLRGDLIDIDGIVPKEYPLLLVDADDHPFFGDFLYCASLWYSDFDPRLQDRSGDHKDDKKHEHHVDERRDVDIGKSDLGAAVRCGESHQRRTSSGTREATGWRSTAFNISSEKSSQRAANSRMEPPIRLYAMTAGIATTRPPAVVIRASEIPGATARKVAPCATPRP